MFGRLPEGWTVTKLRDILKAAPEYGANASATEYDPAKTYRFVRITDIDDCGRLNENGKAGIVFADGRSYRLEENDIVIARTGATVGKSLLYKKEYGPCAFAGYLIRFKINEEVCDPNFVSQFLLSPIFKRWVVVSLRAGAQPNINAEEYQSLHLPLPPRPEQGEIAAILLRWDRAIEQTEKLIAAKTRIKRGLTQQLLTKQKRFEEFDGQGWKSMKISDFAKLTLRAAPKPEKPFKSLGIRSHGKGTFLKEDFEPEKIELTELYEVKENDLIVNITFAWEGAIAIAGAQDSGALVSHRFPTYVFDTERALPEYFRHVIVQKWFVEKLGLISPGGAGRNRVLSKKDFAKLEAPMPQLEEQRRVAAVLNACDREITLLKRQLDALKRQKRGLMQKLLTGQIRIKVEN
jgi:type I restriction enzyme S subunit